MPGKRCVVHGCTNIADLNSLVLKESAQYLKKLILVDDFAICSKTSKCLALSVQYRCLDLDGNSSRVDSKNRERYWRRKTNFRKSAGKSKRTKSKSGEEDRKQQVSHLKTERKNEHWILTVVEIFKCNLKQIMYLENNKYSKERKEDLQLNDLYSRVD